MKEYYQQRFYWIFHYTSKNFWYCLAKTLCILVGLPIYSVCFVLEMVLTAINMLFCWIPVLNVVVMFICKVLITVFGATFYITILTDLKEYKKVNVGEVDYEEVDDNALNVAEEESTTDSDDDTAIDEDKID